MSSDRHIARFKIMRTALKLSHLLALVALTHCGAGGSPNGGADPATELDLSSSSTTNIAGGGQHACAVVQGGKVMCWGDNSYGQLGNGTTDPQGSPVFVTGITTATQVTAGETHSCARLTNGTIKCWGRNNEGQLGNGTTTDSSSPVTTSSLTTATAVGAGQAHSCAMLSTGKVKCWGRGNNGQHGVNSTSGTTTPDGDVWNVTATAIAVGANFGCALGSGQVKCWGNNSNGQLGTGNTIDHISIFLPIGNLSNVTAIAAGATHTCARISNSTVKCWGANANGQVGNNTTTQRLQPAVVSGLSTATGITLGASHSCAKLSDNTVKCWGLNTSGQIGDGTTTQRNTPVAVTGVTGVSQVTTGNAFTCALLSTSDVKCWGSNDGGQLAQGTASLRGRPTLIQATTLNRVMDVVTGDKHTCVLWDTGAVKCWGANDSGQLGNGTTNPSSSPVDVTGITTAIAISAGFNHTCALMSSGSIKCWGENANGQLGNGGIFSYSTTPVSVSDITNATSITMGPRHSCAIISGGTAQCWGRNGDGELGWSFGTGNETSPGTVNGISGVIALTAGGENLFEGSGHTCALLSGGGVKCWGRNNEGQLGRGNTLGGTAAQDVSGLTSGVIAIGAGMNSSCAVLSGGTVKCWGRNTYGQLGNGTTTQALSPVAVSGITNVTSLSAGTSANHMCARLADKTVKCWGLDDRGQLGDLGTANSSTPEISVGATRVMKLARGGKHTCARLDDSTLQCWGDNAAGQLTSAHQSTFPTPTSAACMTVDVVRSDYFVDITTANMPDNAFNGLAGQLDTHRVKPVFFPESCTPQKAVVMVHGRTVEGVSAFDLQYQDYSFMEQLARAGIDTFTFNHLGMGRSSGFTAMSNACNGSLPACLDIGQTCPPPVGVLCDCGPVPTFGVNDKNQQGSTRYLNPNPRNALCSHTTSTRFTTTNTLVQDVDAEVNDALAKSGLSKVTLLGYSAGGIDVGNYLGVADDPTRAARTAKIERAIFVASLFGSPQVTDNEPGGGSGFHSFPMGLMDRSSATAGGFNIDNVLCPGQRDDGIIDPIWTAVKARDSVGSGWGPSQTPAANGGLSRFPHASRWGWTPSAAARITIPVLVMQGLRDNVVPIASSSNLYGALTGTTSKTIVQVGCGSHSIFWEGCSGPLCNGWTGPHYTIFKNSRDWIQTGMIYASPGSDNGSFESDAADGANAHTTDPTSSGPAADESNQLP
jgi:alpha-tubulin suppressor-like RCC1 family protein/pimeloyl-ACP methyl ester carboxylesterase